MGDNVHKDILLTINLVCLKTDRREYWHKGHLIQSVKFTQEETPTFCNSIDGTGEYYAKWNKPGDERQIPYDLTYNGNLMNKTKWAK